MAPAYLRAPPPEPEQRKPGCSGKVAHLSHAEAMLAVRAVTHRAFVYRCRFCDMWHTSSSKKRLGV
jgi:hypothetical protein